MAKNEVLIYSRDNQVSLHIVVPEVLVGNFIVEFGKAFAYKDTGEGTLCREINRCFSRKGEDRWHIIVTIDKEEEERFNDFIQDFCRIRTGVSFRDADKTQL